MGHYERVLKQIEHKPWKVKRFLKHSKPKDREFGKATCVCRRCGRKGRGIIRKYGLYYCRQCFREIAREIGFKKYE